MIAPNLAALKLIVSVVVCWLASSAIASAQEGNPGNPLEATLILDVGWFFMSTDTRVRVDGESSAEVGTDIDFDDTFGIGDFDRFRVEGLWRISKRHSLRAMYFENNRSAHRDISRDVNFGGETFPVGASVAARSELTIIQVSYDYAFLRRENYELAGGIGLHMLDMGLSLDATVTSTGGSASGTIVEDATTTAPLPVVGLRGIWRLPHDFYISAQAQYLYLEFDPYSGSLLDVKASLVWQATPRVGIGVGYNDFRFRFDIDDEGDFNGRLRWNYGGAIAFASVMF
jgi:hypothetical protein